jgi:hypothetical protein
MKDDAAATEENDAAAREQVAEARLRHFIERR